MNKKKLMPTDWAYPDDPKNPHTVSGHKRAYSVTLNHSQAETIIDALDLFAIKLSDLKYKWLPSDKKAYSAAVRILKRDRVGMLSSVNALNDVTEASSIAQRWLKNGEKRARPENANGK